MTSIFSAETNTMFKDSHTSPSKNPTTVGNIDIYPVLRAEELFRDERRKARLEELPALTGATLANYKLYYLPVVCNFAEFVQSLPETQKGFYSHVGGFLDHGLDRTVRAMELCRNYVSTELESEKSEEQRALWNYAVYTASLLFDVGKIAAKLIVTLRQHTKKLKVWNPFDGSMLKFSSHYSYDFAIENWDSLRRQVTPMLAKQLMPEAGFGWLSTDKDILNSWLALLQEDYRQVSAWLSFIPRADAELFDHYFKNYEKDLAEKVKHDKLAVFKDPSLALKSTEISKTPMGKTSGLFSTGGGEGLGMQVAQTTEKAAMSAVAGEAFLQWLKKNLANGNLSVNLPNSGVHVTTVGVLLLEKVFQDFVKANPVYQNWRDVKHQFEQLEVARQSADQQQAFRHYATTSEFKLLTQVTLLTNVYVAFLHHQKMPAVNPYIIPVSLAQETLPAFRPENLNIPPKPSPQQR